jgi:peptide deformylase
MPQPGAPRALEIVTVDSPRGAILRRRAQPVRVVTRDVQRLIDRMFATMRDARGLGLAAPQVGSSRRVIVVEIDRRQLALVDPEIQRQDGEEIGTEACLSIPGLLGDVPRAQHVVVRARNRRNRWVTIEATGLLARVLQHEIDHLDGILFTDRVRDPKTIRRVEETSEVAPYGGAAPTGTVTPDAGESPGGAPSRSGGP